MTVICCATTLNQGSRSWASSPHPAPPPPRGNSESPCGKSFSIRQLPTLSFARGFGADVIHANNVLAHVADLSGVVGGLRTLLKDQGTAVIEVPYVPNLIEGCQFDTIYHEHLCYFSVTALVRLFAEHGLTLVDLRPLATYGGSLRLFVRPSGRPSESVIRFLEDEDRAGMRGIGYYADFALRVAEVQRTLRELLDDLKRRGKRIAGYGVAAKATVLLNSAKIGPHVLDYMVDLNVHKQGKYLPAAAADPSPA